MKKTGILNAELAYELTKLRHTDKMVICDAGYPIPKDATVIDLSLVAGVPTVPQVLKAVLNEIIVEEYVIFDNMKDVNQEYYKFITETFAGKQKGSELSVPEFDAIASKAKFYIRTGELAPCSNIILGSASGVAEMCDPLNVSF